MSSSGSDRSQSSGDRNDGTSLKSDDPGWLHGDPVEGDRQKTICKYYEKKMIGGGITRLKQDLVGGYSNVSKCKSCLFAVRDQMRALLKDIKAKKSEKKIREERFSRTLFNEEYVRHQSINISDSEDDIVYPLDCENSQERYVQKSNDRVKN